jgi:hypothetical protein
MMKYSELEFMKRLKSIDRSLKEISYFLHVFVEAQLGDEPEAPKQTKEAVSTNAIGFQATQEDDECE